MAEKEKCEVLCQVNHRRYKETAHLPKNVNPRPAGVFGRTRPAGGTDFAPCLTPSHRKTEKTANERSQQDESKEHQKFLLKEVRGQVRVRSKVKTTGFHIIGFRAQMAER